MKRQSNSSPNSTTTQKTRDSQDKTSTRRRSQQSVVLLEEIQSIILCHLESTTQNQLKTTWTETNQAQPSSKQWLKESSTAKTIRSKIRIIKMLRYLTRTICRAVGQRRSYIQGKSRRGVLWVLIMDNVPWSTSTSSSVDQSLLCWTPRLEWERWVKIKDPSATAHMVVPAVWSLLKTSESRSNRWIRCS